MSRTPRPTLDALQAALGHVFADRGLLELALSHLSVLTSGKRTESNQRLEFLGDRVLGLAVADLVYRAFPDEEEGHLSRRMSELVRRETCAAVAAEWGVGPHLRLGPGEVQSGGRKRLTTLGDACEALIGAVFLDSDYETARALVERSWASRLTASAKPATDAKTVLQEWAQARALRTPTYRLVSRSGPDHSPRFLIAVDVEGYAAAEAQGKSKRLAEQAAATSFLEREGVVTEMAGHG